MCPTSNSREHLFDLGLSKQLSVFSWIRAKYLNWQSVLYWCSACRGEFLRHGKGSAGFEWVVST